VIVEISHVNEKLLTNKTPIVMKKRLLFLSLMLMTLGIPVLQAQQGNASMTDIVEVPSREDAPLRDPCT